MPAPHLGQTSTRLLLFGSAVAAGALCPIIGVAGVTKEVAAAVASVGGGLVATDVGDHLKLAHRLRESKNILTNHELTKAVGNGIAVVLFAVAEEYKAKKDDWHKDFEKLAKAAPNYWQNIAGNLKDDEFTGIQEQNLPAELFSTKASEFATVKALDENSWIEFLKGLCAENKVNLGDVLIRDTAQKLESIFPKALREVLKDDFEHGGKAFASLTLSMLSEISAGIKENQTAILQLLQNQGIAQPSQQEYNEIFSRLDALANQKTITPEIENALKQVSTQIESGFEKVLREMGVQYEEIRNALSNISTREEDKKRRIEIVEGNQKILEAVVKTTPANLANLDHAYPSVTAWVGRAGELQEVGEYLANSNIALIKIVGVGGIGKSTLAAKVFEVEGSKFKDKFWWDLTISPNFTEFARNALMQLGRFSLQDIQQIPEKDVIDRLVNLLQEKPFLIVIDNLETVLKPGWEGSLWDKFFCRWLGCAGKSKIIVTSQDVPNLTELKGKTLHLKQGLNCSEGATLLRNLGVLGDARELENFVESVGGSPLCLMLVAGLLVTEEQDDPQIKYLSRYGNLYEIKGLHRGKNSVSVKDVFEESFGRLSDQQKQLLLNLSVYRLPFGSAAARVMYKGTESEAENDLNLLAKRCFLLKGKNASGFKFQPVVLGYLKSRAGDLTEVHRKAIEYYRLVQEPEGWKTKEDVSGYIEICYHLGELGERLAALGTLKICAEFLEFQGCYDVLIKIYEKIVRNWQPKDEDEERLFATYLNNLGAAYHSLGEHTKAIEYHEKSLKIKNKFGNEEDIATSLNNLGNAYNSLGEHTKGIEYHEKSLKIKNKFGNQQDIASSLNNLGCAYDALGEPQNAIKYYKKSLKINNEIGNQQGIAGCLNNLGSAYKSLGGYDEAIKYHAESLDIFEKIGSQQDIAASLNNLGNVYYSLGRYDKAIEYHKNSLEIKDKIGNQEDIAISLNNLANAYNFLEEYDKAIEYCKKSLTIFDKIGNQEGIASSLNNLGNVYYSLRKHDEAIKYHKNSLEIRHKIGNQEGIASSLNNLGNVYYSLEKYDEAIKYHQNSLEIRDKIGNQQEIVTSLNNLGLDYASLKQPSKAIEYYEKSLEIRDKIGNQQEIARSLLGLGNAYYSLGQHPKAIEYYEKFLEIKDKIGNRQYIAGSLNNLGNAYNSLGQHDEAIECFKQLLEIKRQTKDKEAEATYLQVLAGLYYQTGQIQKGYAASSQAIEILQESNLPLHSLYPKWLQLIIKFAQKGNVQLALCFIVGLFAFPFALVWIIAVILWRIIRAQINRPR